MIWRLSFLLLPGLLFGCALSGNQVFPPSAGANSSNIKPQTRPGIAPRDDSSSAKSGPGLVVFDPITLDDSTGDLKWFAQGCGLYIHFYAAGQPEFGKTPSLQSRQIPIYCKLRKDLAFTEAEAPQASALIGVTHVATGVLQPAGDKYTLTYRLFSEPDGKALGEPLSVSGSKGEITRGLPSIAKELALRLGAKVPAVPMTMDLTSEELSLIGQPFSYKSCAAIEQAALRDPVAATQALAIGCYRSATTKLKALQAALDAASTNSILWCCMAQYDPEQLGPRRSSLRELSAKFPTNALFAIGDASVDRGLNMIRQSIESARKAVGAAPGYDASHIELAKGLLVEADSIRHGKFTYKLTQTQLSKIANCYAEAENEARKATELNPELDRSWLVLSEAAMWNGNRDQSISALDRAVLLSGSHGASAWIGLEIHQAKWGGSPEEDRAFTEVVANDSNIIGNDLLDDAIRLDRYGRFPELAKSMRLREARRLEALTSKPGDDPAPFSQLADTYVSLGQKDEARVAMTHAIVKDPTNGFVLSHAAKVAFLSRNFTETLRIAQACLDVDPKNEDALALEAFGLLRAGKAGESLKPAMGVLRLNPTHDLAQVTACEANVAMGNWNAAASALGHSTKWTDPDFWLDFENYYKDYAMESYLAIAKTAVHFLPTSNNWTALEDAYHTNGLYSEQVNSSLAGLKQFPDDVGLLNNLAEGYAYTGHKETAIHYYRLQLKKMPGNLNYSDVKFWTKAAVDGLRHLGVEP